MNTLSSSLPSPMLKSSWSGIRGILCVLSLKLCLLLPSPLPPENDSMLGDSALAFYWACRYVKLFSMVEILLESLLGLTNSGLVILSY